MGAFRQSVHAEAAQRSASTNNGGGGTGSGSGATGGPAHVQQRVQEWGRAHYNEKVWRALVRAAKIHKKYVRTPTAVNVKLPITVLLDKKGAVKNILSLEKVGIDDIDDFIKEFFLTTDFPPIPQRIDENEIPHQVTISIRMAEGGHYLQLEPMHE